MQHLTELSRYVYEVANMHFRTNQPFVGPSAFAHKGGMHVHAVSRAAKSYEHIEPEAVGNERRVLVSELSGRSNIIALMSKNDLRNDKDLMKAVLQQVVELENRGYQFEAAEASFDLLVRRLAGTFKPHFELLHYHVDVETNEDGRTTTEASVKLQVGDEGAPIHEVAEGDGPVNALDAALRKALNGHFPNLARRAAGRLQSAGHQLAKPPPRRRCAWSSKAATKTARRGARSACMRTSSKPAGMRWWTASNIKLCREERT